MRFSKGLLVALLLQGAVTRTLACGPHFAMPLYVQRPDVFKELPVLVQLFDGQLPEGQDSFYISLADFLAPLSSAATAVIPGPWKGAAVDNNRDAAESHMLTPAQYAAVLSLRSQTSAGGADTLPPLVANYTKGALAFENKHLDEARQYFRAALSAPVPKGLEQYALWSHYMLGRSADDSKLLQHEFDEVRHMLKAGVRDDVGLGNTLNDEEGLLAWQSRMDVPLAVHLYIASAVRGDAVSWSSLYDVASSLADVLSSDDAVMRQKALISLQDEQTRELMLLYVYAVPSLIDDSSPESARLVDALTRVFTAAGQHSDIGAAHMAAIAWEEGRYDLAEKWAGQSDNALAWWVRGKLALRQGDAAAARKYYDIAISRLQQARSSQLAQAMNCRVNDERALLAVQDRDYPQAIRLMKVAGLDHAYYWWDVAYLADRILTLDELAEFIKDVVPPAVWTTDPSKKTPNNDQLQPYRRLVDLYGRRLMRAGRYADAIVVLRHSVLLPLAQHHADLYKAIYVTKSSRVNRAAAWFALAEDTRENGMDLFGYTLDPDYQDTNGGFYLGLDDPKTQEPDEAARYRATTPLHNRRFHYREIAADEAQHAAALVPPHSQAYAASLCWASYWVLSIDKERANDIYRQYAKHGAIVPWVRSFGTPRCPKPDFGKSTADKD